MIKHKKVYCTFFDYDYGDSIACEYCLYNFNNKKEGVIREAVDIHHIKARGMGSTKCCKIKEIPIVIALCRECHDLAERSKEFNKLLKIIHLKNMIKQLEK